MRGDALGDADDRSDAGVDRFVDRIRGEPGGHEDEGRVGATLGDSLRDRVEDRHAVDVLPALSRRDARDEIRPVGVVATRVERALATGEPLDDEARLAVDDDRHQRTVPRSRIFVSM